MKKLAIFPGTFNPIHIGHLMIAESARIQFELDKVHFVLSPNPPNKLGNKDLISTELRSKLLSAALQDNPQFLADFRETKFSGQTPSFTILTIRDFLNEYSLKEVNLIIGLDAFLGLASWYEIEEIKKKCRFLVAQRPGWNKEELQDSLSSFYEDADWELIDSPPLAVSSSLIRERKRHNLSYRYMLPESIFALY